MITVLEVIYLLAGGYFASGWIYAQDLSYATPVRKLSAFLTFWFYMALWPLFIFWSAYSNR